MARTHGPETAYGEDHGPMDIDGEESSTTELTASQSTDRSTTPPETNEAPTTPRPKLCSLAGSRGHSRNTSLTVPKDAQDLNSGSPFEPNRFMTLNLPKSSTKKHKARKSGSSERLGSGTAGADSIRRRSSHGDIGEVGGGPSTVGKRTVAGQNSAGEDPFASHPPMKQPSPSPSSKRPRPDDEEPILKSRVREIEAAAVPDLKRRK